MPNNYFPYNEYGNPMQTSPEEPFNPEKPHEYLPWQGKQEEPNQWSEFFEGVKPFKENIKEGMGGDVYRIIEGWMEGKEEQGQEQDYDKRLREQTPEQKKIFGLLNQLDMAGKTDTQEYDDLLDMYEKSFQKKEVAETPTLGEMYDYIKENPGAMGAEFANALMADPWLALIGGGAFTGAKIAASTAKAAGVGVKAAKAVELAGGVAGSAVAGGATIGAMEVAEQASKGDINWEEATDQAVLGAKFGAAFGTLGAIGRTAQIGMQKLGIFESRYGAKFFDDIAIEGAEKVIKGRGKDVNGAIINPDETIPQAAERILGEQGLDINDANRAVIESHIQHEVANAIRKVETTDISLSAQAVKYKETAAVEAQKVVKALDVEHEVDIAAILNKAKSEADVKKMVREAADNAGAARDIRILTKGVDDETARAIEKELIKLLREDAAVIRAGKDVDYTKALQQKDLKTAITKELGQQEIEGATTQVAKAFGRSVGSQEGYVSPQLMKWMSVAGLGALVGGKYTESQEGMVGGAITAVASVALGAKLLPKIRGGSKQIKRFAKKKNVTIKDLMNLQEANVASGNRAAYQSMIATLKALPDIKSRQKVTLYLDGVKKVSKAMKELGGVDLKVGSTIRLTKAEKQVADAIRKEFDDMFEAGILAGVLKKGTKRENYASHYWSGAFDEPIDDILGQAKGIGKKATATTTGRAERRSFETFEEGVNAGNKPWSMDIAEIYKRYSNEVIRTIENKKLIEGLTAAKLPDGQSVIMSKGAPANYVTIAHPQLMGKRVHPEMVDSLKFFFDASDPSTIQKGLLAVNYTAKRMLVSGSLFHANALLESAMFANVMPFGRKYFKMIDMLKNGKAGDLVDVALRNGLKIGTIEDVGTDMFYTGMREASRVMDRHIPIVGSAVRGFEWFNKKIDHIMWDRIATGHKLAAFGKHYEKALHNPKYRHMSEDEIAQTVATFVNDAFGGLNWRRLAEETNNKFAREMAMSAFHPQGRRVMQLGMFAPDWTLSNARVLLKAVPGVAQNKLASRLHQAYAYRSAFLFMFGGTAVQSMMWGEFKPLWENEDPTNIEMPDGRDMAIFKQSSEVVHYGTDFSKTVVGKMGLIPKEILAQLTNAQYFSATGAPPIVSEDATLLEEIGARVGHIAKVPTPITAQTAIRAEEGEKVFEAEMGFIGHPITGKKD